MAAREVTGLRGLGSWFAEGQDEVPIRSLYENDYQVREQEAFGRLTISQQPLLDSLKDPTVPHSEGTTTATDLSPEMLAKSADNAKLHFGTEQQRLQLADDFKRPSFRELVNSTMHTVTGGALSLDLIDAHMKSQVEGTASPLEQTLKSKQILNLLDPAGNTMTALAREKMRREGILPEDLQDRLANAVGLAASVITPASTGRKGAKIGTEIFMTSLFSNPASHTANIASNALTSTWSVYERFMAATWEGLAWGASLGQHERQVYFGESGAMMFGAMTALVDAVREAGYTLRTGESRLPNILEDMSYHQRMAEAKKILGERPLYRYGPEGLREVQRGVQEDTVLGQGMGFWSAMWRSPMRALGAEDVAFKIVNRNMEIYAAAYREAAKTGDFSFRSLREFVKNPPPDVATRADQFATALTFQRSISELGPVFKKAGEIGQDIQDLSVGPIPLGRLVVPVMRTPLNLAHFAVERAPILNLAASTFRADFAKGGAIQAMAMGKMGGGVTMTGALMYMAHAGLVSGGGPIDPTMRKNKSDLTGWQPYSIRIGDTWYSYDRLSPLGSVLGLIADAVEIGGQLPEYKMATLGQAIAVAVSHNLTSRTFLEGAADFFGASTGDEKALGRLGKSLISVTTPGIMRGMTRATDPYRRETNPGADPNNPERGIWGELRQLTNSYRANTPGYSKDLFPQLNLWGEPIEIPSGWHPDWLSPVFRSFSPVAAQTAKEDKAGDEIVRLQRAGLLTVGRAGRVILGADPEAQPPGVPSNPLDDGIELTDKEYYDLVRYAGNENKNPRTGLGMHDAMNKMVTEDPRYLNAKDGMKATLITGMVSAYRQAAVGRLLKENDGLVNAYKARLEATGKALGGRQ